LSKFKCGYVAFVGRPNAGKSSLINTLVGEKVSIVTPKPQTTRDNALGIFTDDKRQIVFVDTPGVHKARNSFGQTMVSSANKAAKSADICAVLIDSTKGLCDISKKLIKRNKPRFLVVTKADISGFETIYPLITELDNFLKNELAIKMPDIIPVSVVSKVNLDKLLDLISEALPEGEPLYAEDEYTDKSEDYMVAEIVREKTLFFLRDEIPHGIKVDVTRRRGETGILLIDADIIVERKSHKQIIIGAQGSMLKKIGETARGGIERMLGTKIYLNLFVKVRENWRDK